MEPEKRAATEYWLARSNVTQGIVAVDPGARWGGYHARSRRALQRWTIERMRRHRARYRLGVDLGCGNGDWTELFAQLCDELHASDVSPTFVEQTRQRIAHHPASHITLRDVRDAPVPEGADFVYFGAVLMYLEDREVVDVLKRVRARVASNAHVIIRDWCTYNAGRRTVYPERGSTHRSAHDLRRLGEQVGLRCVEQRSSFSIYGELAAGRISGLAWPLRGILRVVTLPWTRASHTLRFYA
ncbi:MAG: class I SAM-dependent methyltransferase [Kofleriaceae bacterium]|nr:class I SAM-dependent methyltransferase [Kofleriaceae bacterium]